MDPRLTPVLTSTNDNRAQFEVFCRSLSADELATPIPAAPWRVRDYISHLASIDIWVGDWFTHLASGEAWRPRADNGGPFDIDTWNEARIVERADASVAELLEEAARHRAALLATWERFTADALDATFDFRGNTIPLLRYLQLWAGHDPAHAADMLRALPARAAEPALAAWTAPFKAPAG
ncbi:MAG: DinB family protein [Dehalococcoidia bacterium]